MITGYIVELNGGKGLGVVLSSRNVDRERGSGSKESLTVHLDSFNHPEMKRFRSQVKAKSFKKTLSAEEVRSRLKHPSHYKLEEKASDLAVEIFSTKTTSGKSDSLRKIYAEAYSRLLLEIIEGNKSYNRYLELIASLACVSRDECEEILTRVYKAPEYVEVVLEDVGNLVTYSNRIIAKGLRGIAEAKAQSVKNGVVLIPEIVEYYRVLAKTVEAVTDFEKIEDVLDGLKEEESAVAETGDSSGIESLIRILENMGFLDDFSLYHAPSASKIVGKDSDAENDVVVKEKCCKHCKDVDVEDSEFTAEEDYPVFDEWGAAELEQLFYEDADREYEGKSSKTDSVSLVEFQELLNALYNKLDDSVTVGELEDVFNSLLNPHFYKNRGNGGK